MEFNACINEEPFSFNPINENTILVTGNDKAYILYKTYKWNCADDISPMLLKQLGEIIEEHTSGSLHKEGI